MSNFCLKHALFLILIPIFFGSFFTFAKPVQAAPCGNGVCQTARGETCTTCSADCGACPTPIPTSTPIPTPTPTQAAPTPTPIPPIETPVPTPTSPPGVTATPTPTPLPGITSTPIPTPSPGTTFTPTPTLPPGTTPAEDSSDSDSDSSSSIVIYPSITINNQGLSFRGTASISEGVIDLVEYSLDDGNTWSQANPEDGRFDEISEEYTFSPTSIFILGEHKIIARSKSLSNVYTQSSDYANITIAISSPKISLNKISPNPTKDQTPPITGSIVPNLLEISRVQVSFDDGDTWFSARLTGRNFSLETNTLEDGNYPIKARVFDIAGNIGQSEPQILVVDTIPPMIGGSIQTLGPQILAPDENGVLRLVAGTEATIALSMKGGVTEAKIETQDKSFELLHQPGTDIWFGKLKFEKEGEKEIKVSAIDGAANRTERNLHPILVKDFGKIIDNETKSPIEEATISLYIFETGSKQWILWEARTYGQTNPQKTDNKGSYSFMVPPGKFYLDVKAPGFRTIQSEIIDISQTTILDFTFPLSSKPKMIFNLPVFGKVILTIPTFIPQTLETSSLEKPTITTAKPNLGFKVGTIAPSLLLPNLAREETKLSNFRGEKVLVSFISPWSSPSLEQASILSDVAGSLTENQKLLVVSLQESIATTETFMKRGNYKFQVLVDKNGQSAADYKITLLPQHFFIDSNGKIQDEHVGVISKKNILEKLASLP